MALILPSNTVFQLLLTNEAAYEGVTTYENAQVVWPIHGGHKQDRDDKGNKNHQIAHILYRTAALIRDKVPGS